jgi:hypothetical protein
LVTHKAGAKHELLFNKPNSVEHLSQTQAVQQSVAKFMATLVMNLFTPKAGAKLERLFNKPVSST